jgi:glycosyltransferase involved in cell wall biosynthesis
VICVTPVRNEAWTLERFLRSAEQWADHIVLGDQQSTDATREIAARFPKVRVVDNTDTQYHEGNYRKVILDAAREVPGPRAIIAIDADEALSAQVLGSAEWERALREPPGTVLSAWWVNYLPDWTRAWIPERIPIGLIDDGREHNPGRFHAKRFIVRPEDRQVELDDIKVLHFQYTDWARMKSKQRRYQAVESLTGMRPIRLYRRYHRMDAFPRAELVPADPAWLQPYEDGGVDWRSVTPEPVYWWDEEVLDLLLEHGARRFKRVDLWDVDWTAVAGRLGRPVAPGSLSDPRTLGDRAMMAWLRATQRRRPESRRTRWTQRAFIPLGW